MNTKHRLIRVFGTAAVGVFLVASVAFGANAIGQAPGRSLDATLTTSDETTTPTLRQLAEPTETAEPTGQGAAATANADREDEQGDDGEDSTETPEPTRAAQPAGTASPTASPDDHGDDSGHDGGDDSGAGGGNS